MSCPNGPGKLAPRSWWPIAAGSSPSWSAVPGSGGATRSPPWTEGRRSPRPGSSSPTASPGSTTGSATTPRPRSPTASRPRTAAFPSRSPRSRRPQKRTDLGGGDHLPEQRGQLAALLSGQPGREVLVDRLPVDRPGAPQGVLALSGEGGEAGPAVGLVRLALG